jgi:hypothetical protein
MANEKHFQSLYSNTQKNMTNIKKAAVEAGDIQINLSPDNSMILLYRGIEQEYGSVDKNGQTFHGVLESWTSNPDKAADFDGAGVLRAWIPTSAILSHFLDQDWGNEYGPGEPDCEYEFILIMANVPKENIHLIDKAEARSEKIIIPPLPPTRSLVGVGKEKR